MKIRFAAVLYVALALALALFAGTALADGHGHGQGGDHGTSSHQQQSSQQQQQQQSSDQQAGHDQRSHDQRSSSSTGSSGDNSQGVKPSNTTQHNTYAPASSDKTKQYGNGETAGQIATKAGYGSATLHGPGNSQPHKVSCGGHEVDVHALKNKSCGSTQSQQESQKPEQKPTQQPEQQPTQQPEQQPTEQPEQQHKVTICHATGSATNPYVEITVDEHALKEGHTAAKGDIIPAPAGGCPTAQVQGTQVEQGTQSEQSTQTQVPCTTTQTVTEQVVVGVKHFIGPKDSGRFVIIHPNPNSAHYENKHPDELVTQTETKTVTVPASNCSSSNNQSSSTENQSSASTQNQSSTQSSSQQTSSSTAAPSTSSAAPAGSVLGATSPILTSHKAKPAGGVLGATARLGHTVTGTNLPFTGLRLWIFALVALGLMGIGLAARRLSGQR